jgi:hypothetical protein
MPTYVLKFSKSIHWSTGTKLPELDLQYIGRVPNGGPPLALHHGADHPGGAALLSLQLSAELSSPIAVHQYRSLLQINKFCMGRCFFKLPLCTGGVFI